MGGIRFCVEPAADLAEWVRAFGPYVDAATGPKDADVTVHLVPPRGALRPPPLGEQPDVVHLIHDEPRCRFEFFWSHPRLEAFILDGEGPAGPERFPGVLGITLTLPTWSADRLMIHASAVRRRGGVVLFSGPSGAGKTTIASELSGALAPFSLDRLILARDQALGWLAYSTPFGEDGLSPALDPRPERVAALCFIEQASHDRLAPVAGPEAVRRLLQQSWGMVRSAEHDARLLHTASLVAREVPCFNLSFRRQADFWTLIDHAVAESEPGE